MRLCYQNKYPYKQAFCIPLTDIGFTSSSQTPKLVQSGRESLIKRNNEQYAINQCVEHFLNPNLTTFTGSYCRDEFENTGPRTWAILCSTSPNDHDLQKAEGECDMGYKCVYDVVFDAQAPWVASLAWCIEDGPDPYPISPQTVDNSIRSSQTNSM